MSKQDTGSSALLSEIDAVNELLDVLIQEQHALLSGHTEQLVPLLQRKETALTRNNENIRTRVASMIEAGFTVDKHGMASWLKAKSGNSEPNYQENISSWESLLELTDKAQELNRVNGMLIHKRSQIVQERIVGIRGGSATEATYGPNGKKLDSVQSRSLVIG